MKKGFTLVETLITVLILGIIAGIILPNILKAIEHSKARDTVAMLNTIANAQRTDALENPGYPARGIISNASNVTTCNPQATGPGKLYGCKYLAKRTDWDVLPYKFYTCYNGLGDGCCTNNTAIACAQRRSGAKTPYNTWVFYIDDTGKCFSLGTDVVSCD
jgi:prepilin-type N-terminal cleavage/methylation domain-containing protein